MAGGRTDDDDIPIYRTKCPVCRQGIDLIARLKTHGAPHRADSSLKIKASSATTATHRWDSRASVKGQASVARSAKQTKSPAWRGAATGRDPNALNGPPHAVAQATHRLLDVYDTCLRDVDECLGVPRDEWAPPLGYDVGETTFRGAPRLWSAEANHPSGYAKGADAPSALNGASFRRETTVSSLMSVTTLRGSRRAEARASRRGARMATVAGEIRRVQAARHVDWVKGEPPKPRGLARATLDRGRLLGVAAAPHSTYRRVLRATGSGAPPKTSRPKRCGSYTVLTNPDAKRPPEDAVADAVVTHVARDRRRYALRLSGAAACSQQLRSARAPGASAIFDLHTLWRASASENPDPSVIARTQFVTAFRARLSGGPRRAADALYSSLDPRLADRCRVGAATAALLFAHPVWPVDGRDADYSQEERDVLSAVRAAAECYDYDGRGLSSDEISELLDTPCVDREASDRLVALVGSHEPGHPRHWLDKPSKVHPIPDVWGLDGRVAPHVFVDGLKERPELLAELVACSARYKAAVNALAVMPRAKLEKYL